MRQALAGIYRRIPLGWWGGLIVYQYTYNDPLKYIDPSGEIPVVPIIWGVFAVRSAMHGARNGVGCPDRRD